MKRAMQLGWLVLLGWLLLSAGIPGELRGEVDNLLVPSDQVRRWDLRADHFSYDERQGVYSASGNVSIRSGDQLISADKITLDALSRHALLEGHVRIERGLDWLEGDSAFLDLEGETGRIEQGKGFFAENNFYFSGGMIEKLGPQTYHLEQGQFTTCDGEDPSWHFRSSDLRITVDGYAVAKHGRFHLRSFPVLYSPYVVFPAKTTRQSGFLLPRLGLSDLRGFDVDLPFFWAISESTDATVYGHYMSKRGLMPGAEFRYAASETSEGVLRFDYLNDKEDIKDRQDDDFRETGPGFSGDYENRWWWRSKQNFSIPYQVTGKLDLDFVSDADYLREFDTGFSSLEESDKVFRRAFGRDLVNPESATTRESVLLLNKTWAEHSLNGELHYFQNLNDIEDATTLQILPEVLYTSARQPLLKGPFFYQTDLSFVNYWRREGTRGQRLNLNPVFSLPKRLGPYLGVDPFVGLLGTTYLIETFDEPEDSRESEDTVQARGLFEAGVETSSEILRIFEIGRGEWSKIKHTIQPKILYEYRPEVSQGDLPFFESTDRISSRSRLTYSLTNYIVARLDKEDGKTDYRDLARLKISQFYDIKEPEGGIDVPETSGSRPFSNLGMQLDVAMKRYINFTYKNEWSFYDTEFKRHDLYGTFRDRRGDKLKLDYSLRRDDAGRTRLSELDARFFLKLWGGLSVYYRNDYRFDTNEHIKTEYQISMQRQCWGIALGYVDEADDNKIYFSFNLAGLGGYDWGQ